jgi:hypothetical protein
MVFAGLCIFLPATYRTDQLFLANHVAVACGATQALLARCGLLRLIL